MRRTDGKESKMFITKLILQKNREFVKGKNYERN